MMCHSSSQAPLQDASLFQGYPPMKRDPLAITFEWGSKPSSLKKRKAHVLGNKNTFGRREGWPNSRLLLALPQPYYMYNL